jgi:inorganic pyrophosphatase
MLNALRNDGSVNVMVESPRGSAIKFKYDQEEGVMILSRPLPLGLVYPFDWGFIPGTHAADGDPLDAFILWDGTSYPGVCIPCRPIGVVKVTQANATSGRRERNDRIALVPMKSPRQDELRSVKKLPRRVREEIEQFFLHAVVLERKEARLLGWDGPAAAMKAIRAAASARSGSRR